MTTSPIPQLAPEFEAILMLHDGIADALGQIKSNQLLPASAAKEILQSAEQYPYAQLTQPDGKPYLEVRMDGKVKRHYIFADPEEPFDASRMVVMTCAVSLDRGVIVVMPETLSRGPEADFVMSAKYGCCPGGRTMIYSDTSQSRGVFMNMASSGGDVRAEIRQVWARLQGNVLDANGMKAIEHLALDLTGRCSSHEHAQRTDHTQASTWKGKALTL
jgi:hypothetical protein